MVMPSSPRVRALVALVRLVRGFGLVELPAEHREPVEPMQQVIEGAKTYEGFEPKSKFRPGHADGGRQVMLQLDDKRSWYFLLFASSRYS